MREMSPFSSCHSGLQSRPAARQVCALGQDSLLLRLSSPSYKNPHAFQGFLQDLREIRHEKVFVNSELSHALYNYVPPCHK